MLSILRPKTGTIAINLKPVKGSWGGANQWTTQLTRWLRHQGWRVIHDLKHVPDAVIMTHTGLAPMTAFGYGEVKRLKEKHPDIPCIHRINDNDIRKETSEMDDFLATSNTVADHTVFVSSWLRDYHANRWFDAKRPHSVILPGADSRVFHPLGNLPWKPGDPFRMVTHHWSDNWNKGFDVYQAIDDWISANPANGFELWIIGRWPRDLTWKSARTFGPASGHKLASLLRQCHGYVSASRHEPGAMHVAEGLQCGLPILFHPDTGGTPEMANRSGIQIGDSLPESLIKFKESYADLRSALLANPPSGARMSASYESILHRLLAHA